MILPKNINESVDLDSLIVRHWRITIAFVFLLTILTTAYLLVILPTQVERQSSQSLSDQESLEACQESARITNLDSRNQTCAYQGLGNGCALLPDEELIIQNKLSADLEECAQQFTQP